MRRVALLAVAALAVVAVTTVATSVDNVSTEPTVDSASTPAGTADLGGGGGGSGAAPEVTRDVADDIDASTAADSGAANSLPLWQVAAGLGLVLLGSVLALYGLTRGSETEASETDESAPEPTAPAASHVRLSGDVPATNDVYRAWNALCRALPAQPAGETPAAVADAAVATGYDAAAVAELTDLFCAVRYGDARPTTERAARARELAAALSLEVPA